MWLLLVSQPMNWREYKIRIKLFAGQAVNALKSEIATLVTDKIVNADVKGICRKQGLS